MFHNQDRPTTSHTDLRVTGVTITKFAHNIPTTPHRRNIQMFEPNFDAFLSLDTRIE